ncbi:hypothetical protein G8J22_00854 [Lentilactobacillus hilgardii]|uniref:MarR family winged helix-turn-helix transcriptional regulator n=1 Tax=Lentilactobacillus hilgardii TaxID=1588 RepID=UPI00019C57CE|nr:MarR family transcriptional regulator [Lentilactobacillus hilgardii]EEI20008.1 transcriptional regulator, MarR family [Lentilactobacillus buchneri ATCC 11577]MCT3396652.1 MarR family transcriptional regulator [Lentilactobacillus hilgardii]QIR08920.1 hypothetical protein G8J22_00854 [Lentilactobacillus hilgardii]
MLSQKEISLIREFNRDYTELLGLLNRQVFNTSLSWQEGRILLEIKINHLINPNEIATHLKIDKSYTSRIINRLVKQGFLEKVRSLKDSRSVQLKLTASGQQMTKNLDDRSNEQVAQLLSKLSIDKQDQFYQAVETINQLLFSRK